MKPQQFLRKMQHRATQISLLFFLAGLMSCVLVVDKKAIEDAFGKEEVHDLTATAGSTEIDLHWKNPSSSDAIKIEICYGTTGSGFQQYATIEPIRAGKPATQKITGLLWNTQYSFKVVVVYKNGTKSKGKVIIYKTTN